MLCLASWLKEFVDFEKNGLSCKDVADALTMSGLEVEGIYEAMSGLRETVISCIVKEVEEIVGSNGLKRLICFDGSSDRQVVCGAPNVEKGGIYPLMLPGTTLLDGDIIEEKEIMGVVSEGMLASSKELYIDDNGERLWDIRELGINSAGVLFKDFMPIDDRVFEIGITPNRADCLSVRGIARDLSAILNIPIDESHIKMAEEALQKDGQDDLGLLEPSDDIISILEPEYCMRYNAIVIKGVEIRESPVWLQFRLISMGIRPINNVVDCTNLCLLEMGQPLHAFDLNKLAGQRIIVRRADDGEVIVTLDGRERELTNDMLVIADAKQPVAIAGIMGGANSEVSDTTKDILLESAWFEPRQIRKTKKALKLNTEAAYRFERWVDPDAIRDAARRCAYLITKIAGGRIVKEEERYPAPYKPRTVSFSFNQVRRLSGIEDISEKEQLSILERLGFKALGQDESRATLAIPSYRFDIKEEIDIVEEVSRIKGFSSIPSCVPYVPLFQSIREDELTAFIGRLKDIFISQGIFEIISYSFCSPKEIEALGFGEGAQETMPISILNPLSEDQSVMRTSLVPGLMQAVKRNFSKRQRALRLFEVGRCFFKDASKDTGVREEERLMCLMTGRRFDESWAWPRERVDIYDIKGIMELVFLKLGIKGISLDAGSPLSYYDSGVFSWIVDKNGVRLGCIGKISRDTASFWDIDEPIFALELFIEDMLSCPKSVKTMRQLPRFPEIERDIAIILDDAVTYDEIYRFISSIRPQYLEDFFIFDLYKGRPVPKGKKSIALRFIYRSEERTLTDEEVSSIHDAITEKVLKNFGAQLRQ